MKKRPFFCLSLVFLFLIFPVQRTTADLAATTTYQVQPGDTLAAIARRHQTTIAALVEANQIVNPNLIFVGQTLIIPTETNPAVPNPTLPTATTTTYTVRPGDTLFRIAIQFGLSSQTLAQANGITNANVIYVGQVLVIPGSTGAPTPPPATPALPPTTAPPASGENLLPNPSFEGGWYHQNGIPELQLPQGWTFAWDEGENPFDAAPWSDFTRPETRVLSAAFLPDTERDQFIWDGQHTLKIFKGTGAISFRLWRDLFLSPGTYTFEINIFPDLVSSYAADGRKVWAPDPHSGEVRFIVGSGGSDWYLPAFGQKNTLTHSFTITQAQTVRLGVAVRGRYALVNNGWFMDDWQLTRQ